MKILSVVFSRYFYDLDSWCEWGFGWMGGNMMIIFGLLIIVGVFFLIKYLNQNSKGETGWILGTSPRGLDILRERYARGEINKEEFEEKKKDLSL